MLVPIVLLKNPGQFVKEGGLFLLADQAFERTENYLLHEQPKYQSMASRRAPKRARLLHSSPAPSTYNTGWADGGPSSLSVRKKASGWGNVPRRYKRRGYKMGVYAPVKELQVKRTAFASANCAVDETTEGMRVVKWVNSGFACGAGFDERRGRDVFIRGVTLNLVFYNNITPGNFNDLTLIVRVYVDTQVNQAGSVPDSADIRDKSGTRQDSLPVLDNLKRFKLLKVCKKYISYSGDSTIRYPIVPLHIHLKKKISVRYTASSTAGTSYSELDYGGILLQMEWQTESNGQMYNAGSVWKYLLESSITYTS